MKRPPTGEGLPRGAPFPLSLRRVAFRLKTNVDKHLEGRVPGTEPGTEPGDRITHTTRRSDWVAKVRGEETEKARKVAETFFLKLLLA